MPSDMLRLIDPEILVPSTEAKAKPEFWLRFMDWADKQDLMIGPRSLESLLMLAEDPPNLSEFSANDFWPVLGKYAVRPALKRGGCQAYLPGAYL